MNTEVPVFNGKSFTCLAALAAYAALCCAVHAESLAVLVKISINTAGLNLSRPADAREVYRRLYLAARIACGDANRVGLESPPSFRACYEQALAGAVRSVDRPELNAVYLATHTSSDAETYGIEAPQRMAAK
jgi:UrcA family protein